MHINDGWVWHRPDKRPTQTEICAVRRLAETLEAPFPEWYEMFLHEAGGGAFQARTVSPGQFYIRVWSAARVVDHAEGYDFELDWPDALFVGSDGDSNLFALAEAAKGQGIYRVTFDDYRPSAAEWIASSFLEILREVPRPEIFGRTTFVMNL